jgi:glycosyltransferase A (GT-A) superfamily protein (DUF2064 family)
MAHLFRTGFNNGADHIVLIGADSPTLPLEYMHQAFAELHRSEIVLGPSDDGGYYLVGLARAALGGRESSSDLPPIFHDMPWGTPQVWSETLDRLDRAGRSYAVLPRWYDVDELADLERLRDELGQSANDAVFTELRQAIAGVCGD